MASAALLLVREPRGCRTLQTVVKGVGGRKARGAMAPWLDFDQGQHSVGRSCVPDPSTGRGAEKEVRSGRRAHVQFGPLA
eukprot:15478985-Alexandrium_andersonii.AAC.1